MSSPCFPETHGHGAWPDAKQEACRNMADLPSSGSDSDDERRPSAEEASRLTKAALERAKRMEEAKLRLGKRKRKKESDSDFSAGSDASEDSEEDSVEEVGSSSESDVSVSALISRPTNDTATLLLLRRMTETLEKRVLPRLPAHVYSKLTNGKWERGKSGMRLVEARFETAVRAFESVQPSKTLKKDDVPVLDFMQKTIQNADTLHRCVTKLRNDVIKQTEALARTFEAIGDYSSP